MGQTMDYGICIKGHNNSGAYRARWVTHEGRGTGKLENSWPVAEMWAPGRQVL